MGINKMSKQLIINPRKSNPYTNLEGWCSVKWCNYNSKLNSWEEGDCSYNDYPCLCWDKLMFNNFLDELKLLITPHKIIINNGLSKITFHSLLEKTVYEARNEM